MSTVTNDKQGAPPGRPAPPAHREALRAIARDLPRAGASPAFFRMALERIVDSVDGLVGSLEVRLPSGNFQHSHHREGVDAAFWEKTVQSLLTQTLMSPGTRARLLENERYGIKVALLAAPFLDASDTTFGAVVVVAACEDDGSIKSLLARLDALTTLAATGAAGIVTGAPESSSDKAGTPPGVLSRAAEFESVTQMAFTLTNNIRNKAGCDHVSLGLVKGRFIKVVSVSGLDDAKEKNPGVARISAAMEECLDRRDIIVSQDGGGAVEDGPREQYRLHRQWRDSAGAAVASIPFLVGDRVVVIISLARNPARPFGMAELEEYREQVLPYTGAIDLVNRATRSVASHATAAATGGLRATLKPERWVSKLMWMAVLAAAVWFCAGTMHYAVTVPAVIVSKNVQHFAAPADGILAEAPHAMGDRVAKGEIVCAFDTRTLELEARRLETEIAVARIEARRSLADETPVDAQLARAHLDLLVAQKAITDRRLDASVIRAPFDGLILSGDLRGRIGDRFAKGQPLLELTPVEGWILELRIPEGHVTDVERDMSGRFISNARPDIEHRFDLERLRPNAEQVEGEVVFVAEATVEIDDEWIRAGMEGVARIDVGRRRPWEVALDGTLDWLRLQFYF